MLSEIHRVRRERVLRFTNNFAAAFPQGTFNVMRSDLELNFGTQNLPTGGLSLNFI